MVYRLFAVVLMLVGPMPLHICTCAASIPAHCHSFSTSDEELAEHAENELQSQQISADTHAHSDTTHCNHSSDSNSHDRDCPVVNLRPAISSALRPTIQAAPVDQPGDILTWVEPTPNETRFARKHTENRLISCLIPLYLSLRTLRN
jgi:hypothetical protein